MIYFIVILTFLFVWILAAALLYSIFNKDKPIDKLKYFDEEYAINEKYESCKKNKVNILKLMSGLIPAARLSEKGYKGLEMELIKADIPITVEELFIIKILSSSTFACLGFAAFKSYIITPVVFAAAWNVPRLIIANRKKERIKIFDSQLNEGIMVISNSLKAGYSFLQAVAVAAEETKDPFSKEFKKMLKEISLGVSEEDALKSLLLRMESEDLRLIMNAILIQKDIGGNLSLILDNIADTIRERQKIKGELKTLTAQGKLSGIIVMLIPIFLGLTIYLFNKEYILLLFTTTVGIAMIIVSVINQILGLFIIRKIINIDM
jgi:tight adherence protein B